MLPTGDDFLDDLPTEGFLLKLVKIILVMLPTKASMSKLIMITVILPTNVSKKWGAGCRIRKPISVESLDFLFVRLILQHLALEYIWYNNQGR